MMWMMGCNDGGGDFDTIQDPFTGRKLRPLMPRPAAAAAAATPPCFARIHGTDLLALNHHLAAMAEQNKRELNTQQVVVSSRWNPTPEQLQTLEELYRRGTRTPSAEQIQQITAQLRRYGKIEGKNVFYWFQNHKARERQKRRRHLESLCDEHQPPHHHSNNNNIQINETAHKRQEPAAGGNRTAFEVEQTKNWASLTNSSTTNPEKSGERAAECKLGSDGWVQFDEEDENDDPDETQQRRNATWQMMHLSCSSSISPTTLHSSLTSSSAATPTMEMHHHHHPDFINIFFDPHQNLGRFGGGGGGGGGGRVEETQTLQLFPLQSSGGGGGGGQDEEEEGAAGVNSVTPPYKFFEFLPVKN